MENQWLHKEITIDKFHVLAANMYHSYTRRIRGEGEVLCEVVHDELDYSFGEHIDRYQGDDYNFRPDAAWPDLDLQTLEEPEEEDADDTIEEQSAAASAHMGEMCIQCPICLQPAVNTHMTLCGHVACLDCWVQSGVLLDNTGEDPLPTCHQCREGVTILFRFFEPNFVRRSDAMNATEAANNAQAQAEADAAMDLDPSQGKSCQSYSLHYTTSSTYNLLRRSSIRKRLILQH